MTAIGEIKFTGNEESGGCWFCGGDLPKRRRRWCCDEHMRAYWESYNWSMASAACIRRAGDRCENCHKDWGELYRPNRNSVNATIEVHHIIPMKGDDRQWDIRNNQDNLIALCHQCHLEIHAAMRTPKMDKDIVFNSWEEAKKYGQSVMDLSI